MKFAYLIMAHDNPNQLITLIKLLDSSENDIFVHIDKKSENIDADELRRSVKNARLTVYRKYYVKWAGISQTQCQTFLLEEAVKTYHDYYHLLSGHDLPLRSNAEINKFFQENQGKEFIHFESNDYCLKENCRYYNFGEGVIARLSLIVQKKLKINRKLYCGANWYSITHSLATEFIQNKKFMLKIVRWTKSSDEYILQTFYKKFAKGNYKLFKNTDSPFDYGGTARLIDWHRGEPYVWHKEDFNELIESGRMYARKFDEKIDNEIINRVVNYIHGEC